MAQSGSPPPFLTTEISSEMKKKQEEEEEEEAAASIPEGPLVEILSRVPYRSLCRFKCVSKPWLALCSDPDIRKRCPQTLSGFFQRRTHGMDGVRFSNLSGRDPPMVDASLPFLRAMKLSTSDIAAVALYSVRAGKQILENLKMKQILLCAILRPRSGLSCLLVL